MKFTSNPLIRPLLALNAIALICASTVVVSTRVKSDTALTKRTKGLEIVANHVLSKSCWKSEEKEPFKIGDRIFMDGDGRIPTSCIYSPATKQFLQVGYLSGELQVLNIFSVQETKNQISLIRSNQK